MATCEKCGDWIGGTTGPTPAAGRSGICPRCAFEQQVQLVQKSNRFIAIVLCLVGAILLAVALYDVEWRRTNPAGSAPPLELPQLPEPEQVLPDPEPGDDGLQPLREEPSAVPRTMSATVMSLDY